MNTDRLKKDEILQLKLRGVFENFGFQRFKLSKFEEYGFYLENKSFLQSDDIITFSDRGGRLLALKPDITLSIAKNSNATQVRPEKLYYIENVYRYAKHTKEYRESTQMGLEVMGGIDGYLTLEVLTLAMRSLLEVDDDFVLDVSHMAYVTGLLDGINVPAAKERLLNCLVQKNVHEIDVIAKDYSIASSEVARLKAVIALGGSLGACVEKLSEFAEGDAMLSAVADLKGLYESVKNSPYADKLRLDFSIVNDVNYYNGIIFQGYVKRMPVAVLSGGRYDLLMQKFGKNVGAIGFALSLDELSRYYPNAVDTERDMVIIYDEKTSPATLLAVVDEQNAAGYRVRAVKELPEDGRYGIVAKLIDGKLEVQNA